ncbi:hypothetical protein QS306_01525 [Paraburkholderia bonniea]|uniref:hypothetical protein n=1 Tax=Paraburkholderia bonniea TaxID=2152891 RepID=UPI0012913866|nr:hypothetical protein [Paraburkholderia bonniea]WJF90392.1 hypothetical protein QS306_01525 [Paraburkholderia bonniea]WJF93707.1 hypothetical protein QS308_01525 [Paraburkholderia bonniea]
MIDQGLGTSIGSIHTNPGQPDDTVLPIPGGQVVMINSSGTRTGISDFGNAAQGPVSSGYLGSATWVSSGLLGLGGSSLAVTDAFAGTNGQGALFAVNPSSGQRTLLSDFGNVSQGPVGKTPVGVAYASGLLGLGSKLYVVDNNAGTGHHGAIFAVDPATGKRTLFSDFGNSAQGATGVNPIAIAVMPAGVLSVLGVNAGLVVLDDDAGTTEAGAVFVVNLQGQRTLLSDFGSSAQGQPIHGAQVIAVTPTLLGASILVADDLGGTDEQGALWRIASSGTRTMISDFGNSVQGPQGFGPSGMTPTADGSGNVLVTAGTGTDAPFQAQVFLVKPNGQRMSYSDCSVTAKGPCSQPTAITLR